MTWLFFWKDDLSLTNFLKLIKDYGTCSGLKVNQENTAFLVLGNLACTVQEAGRSEQHKN